MPVHPFEQPKGRLVHITIDSEALKNNVLGDPTSRTVAVYLPQGYDDSSEEYPLFVGLSGFTGSGLKLLSWQLFNENLPQRLDRLVAHGEMGPVIAAFPDCFTSLGGNQYINSSAMGNWEDFLLDEMIPAIEREFRVAPGPKHRAVFGKSSGGYGSLVQGMRHGERWGGVACHSGDMRFELVYLADFPRMLDMLAGHGGEVRRFLEHIRSAVKVGRGEMLTLMHLAMAASYDPDPGSPLGIRLPVDPRTCELIEERWQRWLDHDPVRMIDRQECQESLRRLNGLFIDCGSKDQYHLHYGARTFVRELEELGIAHRYEEFEDDHSAIDYRMDISLPFLYEATT